MYSKRLVQFAAKNIFIIYSIAYVLKLCSGEDFQIEIEDAVPEEINPNPSIESDDKFGIFGVHKPKPNDHHSKPNSGNRPPPPQPPNHGWGNQNHGQANHGWGQESHKKLICYYNPSAGYRANEGRFLLRDIDATLCTHIVFAFFIVDGDTWKAKVHESWRIFYTDNLTPPQAVKHCQHKGVKVLGAIGGFTDSAGNKYSNLVADRAKRSIFIHSLIELNRDFGFNGWDFTWIFPSCPQGENCNTAENPADKLNFAILISELRLAMDATHNSKHPTLAPKLTLSITLSPLRKRIDGGYDFDKLSPSVDWYNVLAYLYRGSWDNVGGVASASGTAHFTPLSYLGSVDENLNTNDTISYLIVTKQIPPSKLVLIIPTFGNNVELVDSNSHGLGAPIKGPGPLQEFTQERGVIAFYEICRNIQKSGWKVVQEGSGKFGPYAYQGTQWASFDDVDSIKLKTDFIRTMGLAGAGIWAIDLDDFIGFCGCGKFPLTFAISHALRNIPHVPKNCKYY